MVAALGATPSTDPDVNYYAGVALAQLGRFDEARNWLLAGRRLAPADPRFPTELAGVAFKQKRLAEAARWSQRALRLGPRNAYNNDFLGTVYFLEGNIDAALKYWNRVGKPQIEKVQVQQGLRIEPSLLDRAFSFSPASQLDLDDYRTSEARVEGLGIFASHRFQLAARDDGNFDVSFQAQERNGWGANTWQALLSTFRGVFYQTIYPEYFNVGGSAINFTSLLRWDSEKRRVAGELSGPLRGNPKRRYRVGIDLRNENWDIRNSFQGPSPLQGALNLRREAGSAEVTSFESGRFDWSGGVELSHRDYRSVFAGTALTPNTLLEGFQAKVLGRARFDLWTIPERRFTATVSGSTQAGRIWSVPSHAFGKLEASIGAKWYPKAEGDDYEVRELISGGGIVGDAPFDELFMLGLERDNNLPLRAHIGTRDGRKGSAPLGTRYFLSNAEINKNIYGNGLVSVRVAPFVDTGRITDSSGSLGSSKWLWDTGAVVKVRVLGVGFALTYGKDLRSGNNAFYVSAVR